jgi:hypothetical protein
VRYAEKAPQMEYRITIDISEYGHDPENGERFSRAFTQAHPEVGAVVAQNTETGVLSIVFTIEADDFVEVAPRASDIFMESVRGFEPTQVLSAHYDLVSQDEEIDERAPALA